MTVQLTVLRDNREKKPYDFEGLPVEVEDVTLSTGDYALAELCDHDEENDTYHPTYAVERKSADDFLGSITSGRDRFLREIKRAGDWDEPLEVVIEASYTMFEQNIGPMSGRRIAPSQVIGTVDTWTEHYNVNFHFAGGRHVGARYTFETLQGWLRGAGFGR